jgi:hypothetical protein
VNDYNRFEDLRDKLAEGIARRMDLAKESFGANGRPYGTVRLTPAEQKEYWYSMPAEEQLSMWQGMSPEEQQALKKVVGG